MAPRIKDAYEVLRNNADMVDAVIFTDLDKNKAYFLRNDLNGSGKVRRVYDLGTLRKLPVQRNGRRRNPFTGKSIGPNDVLPLKRPSLPPLYKLFNLFCLPGISATHVSALSKTVAEALRRGTPVRPVDMMHSLCLPPGLFMAVLQRGGRELLESRLGNDLIRRAVHASTPFTVGALLEAGVVPNTSLLIAAVLGDSNQRSKIVGLLLRAGAGGKRKALNLARARVVENPRITNERRESQRVVNVLEKQNNSK